jgi:BlaI family transcriptional regulator, penicillinase repressor
MAPEKSRSQKRRRLPQISDAEWPVMKVVWNHPPVTANQVVAALERQTSWKPKTIQTLLRRLVDKGALTFEKQGRQHLFRPLVQERDCIRAESRSFVQRVFGGRPASLLACFLEEERLTPKEIEELKRLLERRS